jgi:hypothetical protein
MTFEHIIDLTSKISKNKIKSNTCKIFNLNNL